MSNTHSSEHRQPLRSRISRDDVLTARAAGDSFQQIADRFGVTRQAIFKLYELPPAPRLWSAKLQETAHRLREKGLTYRQISEKMGLTYDQVIGAFKRWARSARRNP